MKTQIQTLLLSTLLLSVFSCNDAKLEKEQITQEQKQPQASESLPNKTSKQTVIKR